jgi:hypothetical protein
MQGLLLDMMCRDPAKRIDAATLWHTLQEDLTNHRTMNPADGTIVADATVVLGATVIGVLSPSFTSAAEAQAGQMKHPSASDVRKLRFNSVRQRVLCIKVFMHKNATSVI